MFKVAKVHPEAIIPQRAHPTDAGLDLHSVEDVDIPPNSWRLVDTGIAISIPSDCYGRVAPRSGLAARYGLDVFAGVVDTGYTSSIKVIVANHNDVLYSVRKNAKIAQLIYEKIYVVTPNEVPYEEILKEGEGARGLKGFGSSGV